MTRLEKRFDMVKSEGRAAFVAFLTAGDPDLEASFKVLKGLPGAGVDVIELGMPFTDPMADGPAIQASNLRALAAGQDMHKTLELVTRFRQTDDQTPIVLMGYYNPVYHFGVERFLAEAQKAGVDGLIVVDLPPEEDDELCVPAMKAGLNFIRLATPTTDDRRLPKVLENTSGFVYYVSVAGITGAMSPEASKVEQAVARIKAHTDLPVAVGFGINTPEQAAEIAKVADGVVIGSAIERKIESELDASGALSETGVKSVLGLVASLSEGVRGSGRHAAE